MQRQLGIHMEKNKIRYLPHAFTKINFGWNRDIGVSKAKLENLTENIDMSLCSLCREDTETH